MRVHALDLNCLGTQASFSTCDLEEAAGLLGLGLLVYKVRENCVTNFKGMLPGFYEALETHDWRTALKNDELLCLQKKKKKKFSETLVLPLPMITFSVEGGEHLFVQHLLSAPHNFSSGLGTTLGRERSRPARPGPAAGDGQARQGPRPARGRVRTRL